jgi:hypothetical protein
MKSNLTFPRAKEDFALMTKKSAVFPRVILAATSFLLCLLVVNIATASSGFAQAAYLIQLSQDSFTNTQSQHMTEVEPGAAAWGNTIVTAFQVGRIFSGGGADIGFATSKDGGQTWTNGYLPGLTIFQGGSYQAASDAAVAYNAKFKVWLISTLPIGTVTNYVATSRSTDGLSWGNPILVTQLGSPDKNWITCDNWANSPHYGNCYTEWDDTSQGDLMYMSTSTDGGLTWGPAMRTARPDYGIGGQPLVIPNGNIVVGYAAFDGTMKSFISTNGGQSWNAAVTIANAPSHNEAGNLRSAGLPSAAMDGGGLLYMSWPDCSFRAGCSANDIVYSTSTDGVTWSAVKRVPIDSVTSGIDHFIHGLGIDPSTAGATGHLGLTYYYYPQTNCGNSCILLVGYIESKDGGQTWSSVQQIGGPTRLEWLPNTFSGRMAADYVATVFVFGRGYPIFSNAYPPINSLFQQAIYTVRRVLNHPMDDQHFTSANDKQIPGAKSDHGPRQFLDLDNEVPITPTNHPGN